MIKRPPITAIVAVAFLTFLLSKIVLIRLPGPVPVYQYIMVITACIAVAYFIIKAIVTIISNQ